MFDEVVVVLRNKVQRIETVMETGPAEGVQVPVVFVIDDDQEMLAYLAALLKAANFKVRRCGSAKAFFADYHLGQGGCLISDIIMPEINGLELQEILIQRGVQLPLIFVSAHGNITIAKNAILRGAADFLEKPVNAMELINSVQGAIDHDVVLRRKYREVETIRARLACLTTREREVLDRLVAGERNQEIATALEISLRTVENHRNNTLHKMHVSGYPELLRLLLVNSVIT